MTETERALFLVVTIKPRKDRLGEAEAQLQSMRRNTLNEPGCVFMHLVQPEDDPDNWVMLEMFRSREAWNEHMRQPYNTEGNKILEDLLREPSELRFFTEKERHLPTPPPRWRDPVRGAFLVPQGLSNTCRRASRHG